LLRNLKVPRPTLETLLARLETQEVVEIKTATIPDFALAELLRQLDVRTILYMALRRGKELIGFHTAASYKRQGFSPSQHRIARGIAQLASLALENTRLLEQAESANRLSQTFWRHCPTNCVLP